MFLYSFSAFKLIKMQVFITIFFFRHHCFFRQHSFAAAQMRISAAHLDISAENTVPLFTALSYYILEKQKLLFFPLYCFYSGNIFLFPTRLFLHFKRVCRSILHTL